MKLALGTAQFGLDYGLNKTSGRPSNNEIRTILNYAQTSGIDTLDTAVDYGKCEHILGDIGVSNWKVVTKIPNRNIEATNMQLCISECVNNSIKRLNVDNLYGLLLHDPSVLLKSNGKFLAKILKELRSSGRVKNIGFSIYSPEILPSILSILRPDIVQVPFNILDQRIVKSGWLDSLTSEGIKVYIRSVFLQGLLLQEPENRSSYFDRWNCTLSKWDSFVKKTGHSRTAICLGFIKQYKQIDRVIVGIDNSSHLQQLVKDFSLNIDVNPQCLSIEDTSLIDPFNWII
ncbi:MAG: aldo/keto reductase [Emcibacteraceae bacterium]|nr:aldo/keto reductase [Emcibacteraceae bacterium]